MASWPYRFFCSTSKSVVKLQFAPFRTDICLFLVLLLQFQHFMALMTLNEITILRYLYVYWLKSVGCLNEAFLVRFLVILNGFLGVHMAAYSFFNMSWIQSNVVYGQCTHLDPFELRLNLSIPSVPILIPPNNMMASFVFILVISGRIVYFEFFQKHQTRRPEMAKRFRNLIFSVLSKAVLFSSTIFSIMRSKLTMQDLERVPTLVKLADMSPIAAISVIWPMLYFAQHPKIFSAMKNALLQRSLRILK